MTHIKQLDAVRAIAVILVLFWHWFPAASLINRVPNGPIGVNMFFVLSGFLITRILLEERVKAEKADLSKLMVFKNFFCRRSLRIFPIYYLVVLFLWAIGGYAGTNIAPNIHYFLTYTSNFYFFQTQSWDGILSHTWSLAIEEQFYLVWPWLMLFVNRRWLLPLIVGCMTTGILSQYALDNNQFGEVLPHTCLHAFGMGALLSWIMVFRPFALAKAYSILTKLSVVAVLTVAAEVIFSTWKWVPVRIPTAIITGWLIAFILFKRNQLSWPASWVLNNKPLIFLGKISYGIYLYHPIIPHYSMNLLTRINKHIPVIGNHVLFLEQTCLVILTAYISFQLIERPILALKKYFVLPRKPLPVPKEMVEEVVA